MAFISKIREMRLQRFPIHGEHKQTAVAVCVVYRPELCVCPHSSIHPYIHFTTCSWILKLSLQWLNPYRGTKASKLKNTLKYTVKYDSSDPQSLTLEHNISSVTHQAVSIFKMADNSGYVVLLNPFLDVTVYISVSDSFIGCVASIYRGLSGLRVGHHGDPHTFRPMGIPLDWSWKCAHRRYRGINIWDISP